MIEVDPSVLPLPATADEIASGSTRLDTDLLRLIKAGEDPEMLAKIADLIARREERLPVIADFLPFSALGLGRMLLDDGVTALEKEFHPRSHPFIARAAALARGPLRALLEYEPVRARFDEEIAEKNDNESGLLAALNVPDHIAHISSWHVRPDGITPLVRVGVRSGKYQKLLLDLTGNWDDVAFIASSFATILLDDLSLAKGLIDAKKFEWTDFGDQKVLLEKLDALVDTVGKLEELTAPLRESPDGQ